MPCPRGPQVWRRHESRRQIDQLLLCFDLIGTGDLDVREIFVVGLPGRGILNPELPGVWIDAPVAPLSLQNFQHASQGSADAIVAFANLLREHVARAGFGAVAGEWRFCLARRAIS